jgi:hypothetical protein
MSIERERLLIRIDWNPLTCLNSNRSKNRTIKIIVVFSCAGHLFLATFCCIFLSLKVASLSLLNLRKLGV